MGSLNLVNFFHGENGSFQWGINKKRHQKKTNKYQILWPPRFGCASKMMRDPSWSVGSPVTGPRVPSTWRIIPVTKWLGSPPFISHEKAVWKGSHNPILRGLTITIVINWDDPPSMTWNLWYQPLEASKALVMPKVCNPSSKSCGPVGQMSHHLRSKRWISSNYKWGYGKKWE